MVKKIAASEEVTQEELDSISGSGKEGRVTNKDILQYIEKRSIQPRVIYLPKELPVITSHK